MDVNGNKWVKITINAQSLIAKSVNMTDRQVKNFFYANVNRIFRRLIKLTFQTKKSTYITLLLGTLYSRQIKPKLISSLLCVEGPHSISDDIKQNFKNLILENQDIQHYSKLNQETQQQVSNIFEYLEQEKYYNIIIIVIYQSTLHLQMQDLIPMFLHQFKSRKSMLMQMMANHYHETFFMQKLRLRLVMINTPLLSLWIRMVSIGNNSIHARAINPLDFYFDLHYLHYIYYSLRLLIYFNGY
ncbi:hypothetical protein FGO68_gene12977 [Halteria grandinella]|uniref:Uncharacterized protein n=1 Tax=Halteria grandinella TaxID=5974 RepID=A0A8J8NID9_HALGN|nr:hypothetical protein FGO68_gene12977 [Halteria grandinella]